MSTSQGFIKFFSLDATLYKAYFLLFNGKTERKIKALCFVHIFYLLRFKYFTLKQKYTQI